MSYQTNKPPVLIQELMGLPREARKDLTIRNRSPLRFGHRINEGDMLISLHRLLSAVLAIDAIQMRTKDNPDDPLRRLHGECFEDEVTHLLVSTAAFNRVYRMQRHPRRISPDNITNEPVQGSCGNLWIDSHDPQSQQPLSFKDACDKILHADVINFSTPLKTFTMMGKLGGRAWTAELDLFNMSVYRSRILIPFITSLSGIPEAVLNRTPHIDGHEP